MTQDPDATLLTLRSEVERLLGRCLLRLQNYELLTKAVLAGHDISGSFGLPETALPDRRPACKSKTLGTLVNQMRDSFLVDSSNPPSPEPQEDGAAFRSQFQIGFSTDDLERIEGGLKKLVALRNDLVHHFIETHDLLQVDGCQKAKSALVESLQLIGRHYDELRQWATDLIQMRQRVANALTSGDIHRWLIEGIIP